MIKKQILFGMLSYNTALLVIDEPLYLLEDGNIRADGECFATPDVEIAGHGLDAVHAPGAQHNCRAARKADEL